MAMNPASTITLNGARHEIPESLSVGSLLESIGFTGKPVVVELNEQVVFPRDYAQTLVQPGARVEIVALAAGG